MLEKLKICFIISMHVSSYGCTGEFAWGTAAQTLAFWAACSPNLPSGSITQYKHSYKHVPILLQHYDKNLGTKKCFLFFIDHKVLMMHNVWNQSIVLAGLKYPTISWMFFEWECFICFVKLSTKILLQYL